MRQRGGVQRRRKTPHARSTGGCGRWALRCAHCFPLLCVSRSVGAHDRLACRKRHAESIFQGACLPNLASRRVRVRVIVWNSYSCSQAHAAADAAYATALREAGKPLAPAAEVVSKSGGAQASTLRASLRTVAATQVRAEGHIAALVTPRRRRCHRHSAPPSLPPSLLVAAVAAGNTRRQHRRVWKRAFNARAVEGDRGHGGQVPVSDRCVRAARGERPRGAEWRVRGQTTS